MIKYAAQGLARRPAGQVADRSIRIYQRKYHELLPQITLPRVNRVSHLGAAGAVLGAGPGSHLGHTHPAAPPQLIGPH